MAENKLITIGHTTQLSVVIYNNVPVLTFDAIDMVHTRSYGTARKRFHENRQRFTEGKHYYMVSYAEAEVLEPYGVTVPPRGLTLITKRGYLLLVKSFTDDLAWDVQEQLVDYYFEGQPQQRPTVETISAVQLQQIRGQMENVTRYMKHDKQKLVQTLYRLMKAEFGYDKIENLPAADLPQVLDYIGSYQDVAHQVWDITNAIERGFIQPVKQQQRCKPNDIYRDVLAGLKAPLRLAIAA